MNLKNLVWVQAVVRKIWSVLTLVHSFSKRWKMLSIRSETSTKWMTPKWCHLGSETNIFRTCHLWEKQAASCFKQLLRRRKNNGTLSRILFSLRTILKRYKDLVLSSNLLRLENEAKMFRLPMKLCTSLITRQDFIKSEMRKHRRKRKLKERSLNRDLSEFNCELKAIC